MDDFNTKQVEINRLRTNAVADYPRLWSSMIDEWRQDTPGDHLWLMYAANYLFSTAGVRWAIDPFSLHKRLPEARRMEFRGDLSPLSFIILTHYHADHIDPDLLRELVDLPITWIIPQELVSPILNNTALSIKKIIIPTAFQDIHIGELTITPFNGMHWEKRMVGSEPELKGVPATAYLVAARGKRWLFPGDVRTYDPGALPEFTHIDVSFAHLWLGRSSALLDAPPLLTDFCRFHTWLKPKRLVLTHLYEYGRSPAEFWDLAHAQKVIDHLHQTDPGLNVTALRMGDRLEI